MTCWLADLGPGVGLGWYLHAPGWGWFLTQLAARCRVSQSWCQPTGEWGWIPGWLAEGYRVSQSWCRPGVRIGPRFPGCRALGVPKLVSACLYVGLAPDPAGYGVWAVPEVVLAHWLVGLDPGVAGQGTQGVSELLLACWWVGRVLAWQAVGSCVVPGRGAHPPVGRARAQGNPKVGACPLVGETG